MDKNFKDEENDLNEELFGMVNSHSSTSPYVEANYGRTPTMPEDYRINAKPGRDIGDDKPYYPHTPPVPPKAKYPKKVYTSNKKANEMKKRKIPKPLVYLLSAAILAGGIGAITLGYDYFHSKSIDKGLSESQENLSETSNKDNSAVIETYQQQDNSLEILNSDLNNLLQKYKEDPKSVTQEEVKTLIKNCYSVGQDVIFSKIDSALDSYYQNNPDEVRFESDNTNYVYKTGDPEKNEPMYYIAESRTTPNGLEVYTSVASGKKIESYIAPQKNLLDLSNKDNLNIEQAIKKLKECTTSINNMQLSKLHFEKGILSGKNLVIDDFEKSNDSFEDR